MKHSDRAHRSMQFAFRFDQSRCNGCKTCEVACIDYHGLEGDYSYRTIYDYEGGAWSEDEDGAWSQDVFSYHLSLSCNHCSNPVCIRFCTKEAIAKDENGFVVIDQLECVGCQACMMTCPYHAPRFDEATGTICKCDGCRDRIDQGLDPICVDACPQRALSFGLYASISDEAQNSLNVDPLPNPAVTQPNFIITLSPLAKASQYQSGDLIGH